MSNQKGFLKSIKKMESYTKDSIINTLKINWKLIEKLKRVRLI